MTFRAPRRNRLVASTSAFGFPAHSRATEFTLDEDGDILPPINSLPGIGAAAAEGFVEARKDGPFISQDDMVRRKVSKSMVEQLRLAGCLNDIPETSQVTLFEFTNL